VSMAEKSPSCHFALETGTRSPANATLVTSVFRGANTRQFTG